MCDEQLQPTGGASGKCVDEGRTYYLGLGATLNMERQNDHINHRQKNDRVETQVKKRKKPNMTGKEKTSKNQSGWSLINRDSRKER